MKTNKLNTYKGNLELYYETGMEGCHAPILHDDRGIYKAPGYNKDTKKWDGPDEEFHSFNWTMWFKGGEHLKVFENNKIIFDGIVTKDRQKIRDFKYALGFIPKEVEILEWLRWFQHELRAEILTDELVDAEKPKDKGSNV